MNGRLATFAALCHACYCWKSRRHRCGRLSICRRHSLLSYYLPNLLRIQISQARYTYPIHASCHIYTLHHIMNYPSMSLYHGHATYHLPRNLYIVNHWHVCKFHSQSLCHLPTSLHNCHLRHGKTYPSHWPYEISIHLGKLHHLTIFEFQNHVSNFCTINLNKRTHF